MFCNVSERYKPQNLCAAGIFHASAQNNNELHVYDFTWHYFDLEIFSKLSTGNVASSEIYYHKMSMLLLTDITQRKQKCKIPVCI